MKQDNQIFDLISEERARQMRGIELIASENFVSEQVMAAMGSVLTNKYAEGYPAARYYGGCEVVDESEQLAIDRIKELYGAEWANVQPHSGADTNLVAYWAILSAKVETPTLQNKTISFGNNLVQDIVATKNIMFEIQIEGYDDKSKIYIQSTDKIDISLSAFAKANINITPNTEK